MNSLLLTALTCALLYYFLLYLPNSPKKPNTSREKATQTNQTISPDPELATTLDQLITEIQQLNQII